MAPQDPAPLSRPQLMHGQLGARATAAVRAAHAPAVPGRRNRRMILARRPARQSSGRVCGGRRSAPTATEPPALPRAPAAHPADAPRGLRYVATDARRCPATAVADTTGPPSSRDASRRPKPACICSGRPGSAAADRRTTAASEQAGGRSAAAADRRAAGSSASQHLRGTRRRRQLICAAGRAGLPSLGPPGGCQCATFWSVSDIAPRGLDSGRGPPPRRVADRTCENPETSSRRARAGFAGPYGDQGIEDQTFGDPRRAPCSRRLATSPTRPAGRWPALTESMQCGTSSSGRRDRRHHRRPAGRQRARGRPGRPRRPPRRPPRQGPDPGHPGRHVHAGHPRRSGPRRTRPPRGRRPPAGDQDPGRRAAADRLGLAAGAKQHRGRGRAAGGVRAERGGQRADRAAPLPPGVRNVRVDAGHAPGAGRGRGERRPDDRAAAHRPVPVRHRRDRRTDRRRPDRQRLPGPGRPRTSCGGSTASCWPT